MTEESEIFDAEFLASLRRLFVRLQQKRPLQKHGVQLTSSQGSSREFKDRRSYVSGDDYRNIDWHLFARFERLYIRLFENIQEYHVHVLIDTSLSMSQLYPEKRIIALRAALALAYLALCNNHRVSFHLLGEQVERLMPPLKGQGHIHKIIQQLEQISYDTVGDPAQALRRFRPGRDGKGMFFLCSDLLGDDPEAMVDTMRTLGSLPLDGHVIHILSPEEMDPTLQGSVLLQAVEGDEQRRVYLNAQEIEQYKRLVEDWQEQIRSVARSRRIDYLYWPTDLPFDQGLLEMLERGQGLVGQH